jgi:signal transduction histidine kinase
LKVYLEEILLSLSNIVKKTNVYIKIVCDEDINIFADAGSFSQIINNLIINSLSHAFSQKEKGEIFINCIKNENNIVINYSDNGKGIKEENIEKIFEPFFTTNRKNGGTGLGLHIIHNIVTQAFEGSISCKSEKNKGVEFQIVLNNI